MECLVQAQVIQLTLDSHVLSWQVDGQRSLSLFTVLPVTDLSYDQVINRHENHSNIQNSSGFPELLRVLHRILQWQNESNSIERKHRGSEKQRNFIETSEIISLAYRR